MEAIGRLAGGIAHDFNNLLTVVLTCTYEGMEEGLPPQQARALFEEIQSTSKRAAELTRRLLAFGRKQVLEMIAVDLNELVKSALDILTRVLGEQVALEFRPADQPCPISADVVQIEHVLVNLAINARDAMQRGGRLLLATEVLPAGQELPGPSVRLTVSDDGEGMEPEVAAQVFEPYFTLKGASSGTGLGLSMVQGIVTQHNGTISIESAPGAGTTFSLVFPRSADPCPTMEASTTAQERSLLSCFVLCVEDEPQLRKVLVGALGRLGCDVHAAASGEEALAWAAQHEGQIDLLLTDVNLGPGLNGKEVAEQLKRDWPETKIIYTSGYTDNVIAKHGVLVDGTNFIAKPFTPAEFAAKVREVMHEQA